MCGVFAYIGKDDRSILKTIRGLKDLEYRGYDSWGVLALQDGGMFLRKTVGKIGEVREQDFKNIKGNISLGHSRWATHGKVTTKNAHPHTNKAKTIAVVHNGIIENYLELKKKLKGKKFVSETDSEVVPHLIEHYLGRGDSFEDAFVHATNDLHGRYAIVVASIHDPRIFVARNGSPLIIGKGDGEMFVASDIPAFLDYTNIVNYIDDGEYAFLDRDSVEVFDLKSGKQKNKKDIKIEWSKESSSKEDFAHFMIKEIMEQKESLRKVLTQEKKDLAKATKMIKDAKEVYILGCGTAAHMGRAGEQFFSRYGKINARVVPASEFALIEPFISNKTLVIAVSQSGETADVLDAVKRAKKRKAKVLSILNMRGSSLERISDFALFIKVGPEKAVASTKAASAQMTLLLLLACLQQKDSSERIHEIVDAIGKMNDWLNPNYFKYVENVAKEIGKHDHMYTIGRGVLFPVALEAALKIQEVSYIHAEGFAGGELKHGPIALIAQGTPVLALVGNDETRKDIQSNVAELRARGAFIVGVADEDSELFDLWLSIPKNGLTAPIMTMISLQTLAYYLALFRGTNPDMPRNLAKSVTVK